MSDLNNENFLVCPHLGLANDPGTRFMYPAEGNYCHKVKPSQEIGIGYQGQVCLTEGNYLSCPIYQKGWEGKLPNSIRNGGHKNNQSQRKRIIWPFFTMVVVIVLAAISFFYFNQFSYLEGEVATLVALNAERDTLLESDIPNPTEDIEPTITLDEASILLPSITPVSTIEEASPNPEFTSTPFINYARYAVTPLFGPNNIFILHNVALGENLTILSNRYDTSIKSIQHLNCLVKPIHVGDILLIAPGIEDTTDLPSFLVVENSEDTNISILAETNFTDEASVLSYNGLDDINAATTRKWIIIPTICEK